MSKTEQRIARLRARADELVGARALELEAEAKKRRQAIAAAIDGMLETMEEVDLLHLFRRLEAAAPARARRIIVQHPLRPASLADHDEDGKEAPIEGVAASLSSRTTAPVAKSNGPAQPDRG